MGDGTKAWTVREVRLVARRIHRPTYRYRGFLEVADVAEPSRRRLLPLPGTLAQWLEEGETLRLELADPDESHPGFDAYALARADGLPVWPPHHRTYEEVRTAPAAGETVLYRYRVAAREARFESDFEAIVELEQYHYASEEERIALWWCERCDRTVEANVRPSCPDCGGGTRFADLRGATRASRFLLLELLERAPWEPRVVGYVRLDPPLPLMHRRLPDGGIERHIREKVFPRRWFARPFWPEALARDHPGLDSWTLQGLALARARAPVSRLARIVVHPDYRTDGLGRLGIAAMVDWARARRVPDMRERRRAIETVAAMARYHPFLERAGFVYLWDTASGRPTLYRPLDRRAEGHIRRFLETDPVARGHGGRLYRSRFTVPQPLSAPVVLRGVTKLHESRLDLDRLAEPVRRLLEAFGVRRRVLQRWVLKAVDLEVPPGAVIAVLGASGAGKTTLLRLLYGALAGRDDPPYRADAGEVSVPAGARVAIHLPGELEPVFDAPAVVEDLFRVCGDEALAVELLNLCGLADAVLYRAPFRELSTGQKERARLARLLAERPNVLLVDELAAHLDAATAMRVARRLAALAREKGVALVAVTHRREVVEALAPDELHLVGWGTLLRAREPLVRALRVREPWASHIVDGRKRWEIRRYPTRVRGRVGVASGGRLLGSVEITGTRGPFTVEELRAHQDRHLADERFLRAYAGGGPLGVGELAAPRRYETPLPLPPRPGQRSWLRLDRGGEEGEAATTPPPSGSAEPVPDADGT